MATSANAAGAKSMALPLPGRGSEEIFLEGKPSLAVDGVASADAVVAPGGEAAALAPALGPPPLPSVPANSPGARADIVLRLLDGTWSLRSASMNGRPVPDAKFASGTWTFSAGTLSATNGEGAAARFTLAVDPVGADAFRVESVAPSKEEGDSMFFRREGERLDDRPSSTGSPAPRELCAGAEEDRPGVRASGLTLKRAPPRRPSRRC